MLRYSCASVLYTRDDGTRSLRHLRTCAMDWGDEDADSLSSDESLGDEEKPYAGNLLPGTVQGDDGAKRAVKWSDMCGAFGRPCLLVNQADVMERQGRLREATVKRETALELLRDAGVLEGQLESIAHIAALYRRRGLYAEAQEKYEDLLASAKHALGPEHEDVAHAHSQVGRMQVRARAWSAAVESFNEAATVYSVTTGPESGRTKLAQREAQAAAQMASS